MFAMSLSGNFKVSLPSSSFITLYQEEEGGELVNRG